MSKTDTDVLINGAGVIGLAISYFLSKNNIRVVLIEKEKNFGTGVSSRNTEVIHAGIYYKKNSLKLKSIDGVSFNPILDKWNISKDKSVNYIMQLTKT